MSRGVSRKVLFAGIVAAGALLRFGGLSHDLHEGRIYHPDTPKQMRQAQRFMQGRYYRHTGLSDYDGYPFFSALNVAWIARAGAGAWDAARSLVGIPHEKTKPDVMDLYWIALFYNATLSTLIVTLVLLIALENFGFAAAAIAGLFVAWSPLDVIACHFATGDTAAAFFATLSLLFAFRILRRGWPRDYVGAAVFAVFGFAAKYHAGMVLLAAIGAHALRCRSLRELVGRESLARLALMGAAGVVALFLSIPGLLVRPVVVLGDMRHFMTAAMVREPGKLHRAGYFAKLVLSLRLNAPVLLDALGAPVLLCALFGIGRALRRSPGLLVLSVLPVAYFFVGVASRPLALPVYHSLVTPALCLLAGAFLSGVLDPRAGRRLLRGFGVVLVGAGAACLLVRSLNECFFFRRPDTRRVANHWAIENIPWSFEVSRGRYTFGFKLPPLPPPAPKGRFHISSAFDPRDPPEGFTRFASFALEPDRGLAFFRNPRLDLFMEPSAAIRKGGYWPALQRWPSETGNEFVFDESPGYIRDGKTLQVPAGKTVERWLVSREPLDRVWLIAQNGPSPNGVRVTFGRKARTFRLRAGEAAAFPVHAPAPSFFSLGDRCFYRVTASAALGMARVSVATSAAEAGRLLYAAGLFEEAADVLRAGEEIPHDPVSAAIAEVCSAASTNEYAGSARVRSVADRLLEVDGDADLFRLFGIGAKYLAALPFARFDATRLESKGYRAAGDPARGNVAVLVPDPAASNAGRVVSTELFIADPGYYVATVRLASADPSTRTCRVRAQLRDALEVPLDEQVLDVPAVEFGRHGGLTFKVCIPPVLPVCSLALDVDGDARVAFEEIRLRPDPVPTLRALAGLVRVARGGSASVCADEPAAYAGLVALGDAARIRSNYVRAAECQVAAARAGPGWAAALERLADLSDEVPGIAGTDLMASVAEAKAFRDAGAFMPAEVVFSGGIRLEGARLESRVVKTGRPMGLNLYWNLDELGVPVNRFAAWVHFVDESGAVAWQGDHWVMTDLALPLNPPTVQPFYRKVVVPADVEPGEYRVRVGVHAPRGKRRFRVWSSTWESDRHSAWLPVTVRVEKGEGPAVALDAASAVLQEEDEVPPGHDHLEDGNGR